MGQWATNSSNVLTSEKAVPPSTLFSGTSAPRINLICSTMLLLVKKCKLSTEITLSASSTTKLVERTLRTLSAKNHLLLAMIKSQNTQLSCKWSNKQPTWSDALKSRNKFFEIILLIFYYNIQK